MFKQKDSHFPIECHIFFYSIKKFFKNLIGVKEEKSLKRKISKTPITIDEESQNKGLVELEKEGWVTDIKRKDSKIHLASDVTNEDEILKKMHHVLHKKYDKSSFVEIDTIFEV